jgi:phage gp37-like protein
VRVLARAPYAAYLRVYEPLAAFPEPARSHWSAYAHEVLDGRHARAEAAALEHAAALARLVSRPPLPAPVHESGHGLVLVDGSEVRICPSEVRLRSWWAVEDLPTGLPTSVADSVLPPVVRAQAAADLARWRTDHGDGSGTRPHTLTARWQVPPRWFVLVAQDERRVDLASPRTVLFRSTMAEARRRSARAVHVLRRAQDRPADFSGLTDLARWLEAFHPRSVVELDYGGLADLIPADVLRDDRSAAEVAQAVTALRQSEWVVERQRAETLLSRLDDRWRSVRALERAN